MPVLAVESSFDDTGIALVTEDFEVSSALLSSSVELHAHYGGVVPELAARDHLRNLPLLLREVQYDVPHVMRGIVSIGVTRGPGLPGCLLAGVSFCRGIACASSLPLYGLNHLYGHLFSPFFGKHVHEIPFPFLGLIVTGGNTVMYLANSLQDIRPIAETLDDAAGELFDKVAFRLGLGYPGGKRLEQEALKVASQDLPKDLMLPVPMRQSGDLNFSFSGLKTSALKLITRLNITSGSSDLPFFALSLQRSVWESLWLKLREAVLSFGVRTVSVSGGVSLNTLFRSYLAERCASLSVSLHFPMERLCMDNAEMMAYLLLLELEQGKEAEEFDIDSNLT